MPAYLSSPFFTVLFWIVLVAVLAFAALEAFRVIVYAVARLPKAWLTAFELLALIYYFGVACKLLQIGPLFFRYHLADIGFPVGTALIPTFVAYRFLKGYEGTIVRSTPREMTAHSIRDASIRIWSVIIMLGAAVAYEFIAGGMVDTIRRAGRSVPVGSFDLVDVAMYFIGAAVGIGLLTMYRMALQRQLSVDIVTENDELRERRDANSRKGNGARRYARSKRARKR